MKLTRKNETHTIELEKKLEIAREAVECIESIGLEKGN